VYRDYVDISVAVATEKGLVTPVVRNTETMDLIGIEKSISDLGRKVRQQTSHGRTSFGVIFGVKLTLHC
jgi:pyruvate/2-oxoglutarate dehydrogenase complex dihydrolipoamide acyltransferase (E2) component